MGDSDLFQLLVLGTLWLLGIPLAYSMWRGRRAGRPGGKGRGES